MPRNFDSAFHSPGDFLPARGRPRSLGVVMSVGRELTAGDIAMLALAGPEVPSSGPPSLQNISHLHHTAARMIAEGRDALTVAFAVGRTPQRIRDLCKDPMFKELVGHYADQVNEVALEASERAKVIASESVEIANLELRERLEDPAKRAAIPTSEIRQIIKDLGDRTILPPKVVESGTRAPTNITFVIPGRGIREIEAEPQAEMAAGVEVNPATSKLIEHEPAVPAVVSSTDTEE